MSPQSSLEPQGPPPSLSTVLALARGLEVPAADLFGGPAALEQAGGCRRGSLDAAAGAAGVAREGVGVREDASVRRHPGPGRETVTPRPPWISGWPLGDGFEL